MLGTVSQASDVIALFTADHPEWGVSQVAGRMELAKSSAHALLSTLAEIGPVRRTASGRYRLGWRVFEPAPRAGIPIPTRSRPAAHRR